MCSGVGREDGNEVHCGLGTEEQHRRPYLPDQVQRLCVAKDRITRTGTCRANRAICVPSENIPPGLLRAACRVGEQGRKKNVQEGDEYGREPARLCGRESIRPEGEEDC